MMHRENPRQGVAIPMVMGFAFLAAVFVGIVMSIRVEDKRQNLMSFQQLKAHYMAQGAIQHALLKIRILPNEIYDVSQLARGICPADTPTTWDEGLTFFRSDIKSSSEPEFTYSQGDFQDWSFEVTQLQALTAFYNDDSTGASKERRVNVLEIKALGVIDDRLQSDRDKTGSDRNIRKEEITKTIEVTRTSL